MKGVSNPKELRELQQRTNIRQTTQLKIVSTDQIVMQAESK